MCKVPECPNPSRSRGMCSKHYTRWWKHKDSTKGSIHNPPTGLQKFFVVLNYLDGMSQRKIALAVGISRWQVAKILK